jgi:hypothetical protein
LATGADLRLRKTTGKRPLAAGVVAPYFDALLLATRNDPVVHKRFFDVLQMLKPVSSFFGPGIVARVAADVLRKRFGGERAEPIPATPDPEVVTAG